MVASIIQMMDTCSSDDKVQVPDVMKSEIPECEGIPRRRWNTRCVTIYNQEGHLVSEGTCHSVSSDLVLVSNGPLGYSCCCPYVQEPLRGRYSTRMDPLIACLAGPPCALQ